MGIVRAARAAIPLLLVPLLLAPYFAPTPARAAAAERWNDERVELPVGWIESPSGIVVLKGLFSRDGRGQEIALWRPGADPQGDPETYRADPTGSPRYELSDGRFVAFVPLVDHDGQPAGEAVIRADLVPAGERKAIATREHSGTTWFREVGWTEPVTASGTIDFPGDLSFAFADVAGAVTVVETFATNPDAVKLRQHYSFTTAFVERNDAFVAMALFMGEGMAPRIELVLIPADPSIAPLFANAEVDARDPFGASIQVPLESPDGPVETPAQVEVRLTGTGQREVFKTRSANSLRTVIEEALAVEGSVSFPGGFDIDLSAADATLVTVRFSVSDPDGGRPAGAVPANDAAGGAVPLRRGDAVKGVWTGGAAPMPEETFSEALGHTVWYRIEGNGLPVTVDTAGSDFDTVISLHRSTGDGLELLGEWDDQIVGRTDAAIELQARTTWETESGVTYFVQVGGINTGQEGFPPESGRLTVTVAGG